MELFIYRAGHFQDVAPGIASSRNRCGATIMAASTFKVSRIVFYGTFPTLWKCNETQLGEIAVSVVIIQINQASEINSLGSA
jgi:hypothetical protein